MNLSLLFDPQYGFRQARSISNILSYITNVCSSYEGDTGEFYAVSRYIGKPFDRVWHGALISKRPFSLLFLCSIFLPPICQRCGSWGRRLYDRWLWREEWQRETCA